MITFAKEKEASSNLMQAMASGDEKAIQNAWVNFHSSIVEQVKQDIETFQESNDVTVLAQRGYRQLTSQETKFYNKVISALKSPEPKQAFATIIGSDEEDAIMPETILTDVYKYLEDNHPLLNAINFTFVGYSTKWVLNDHTVQTALWGSITDTITKEITSAFKVIDVNQNKLSAFALIEQGMLDLGPAFLDGYVRRVLAEALATGLEYGIVKGTGKNEPIGLIKDIHEGVSVSSGVYPDKTASYGKETVTEFTTASYGALVAKLAKTENGRDRTIDDLGLTLLVNPTDYYTKVMPATTVLTAQGTYANNLFPVPTQVIQSAQLTSGQAVLFLAKEYRMFAGAQKKGVLEYTDEYKFFEDQRAFKIKTYATGRAFDNNSALLLDITGLQPGYINVAVSGSLENTTTVSGEITTTPTA